MKLKSTSRLAFPLASAIAAMLASSSVHADQIWDGGSTGPGDDNWNTAANWGLNTLPTFTNAINFVGNVRNGAVNNLTADSTIGGINLTNDGTSGKTNAFTLSGARITLGGNITTTTASSSAITDTISLAMILNDNRTITTNTNHNLTVSGIISQSGTRRLTKDGAGILTLSNANTYSGGTTLSAGTLNVANVSGLGASSTLSITAAATLRLSTDTAFGGSNPVYNVQMQGGGTYASTIELNRATAGASTAITHNFGSFTMSLNGGQAGQLNVTAGANAPTGGGGALDTIAFTSMSAGNNNTVTETLNPTGGNITIGALTAFGNQIVTMALSGTTAGNAITGVIGGTGNQQLVAISKIGNSTWTLSNAGNNYTGGTTFSGGTLVFANGALGTTGAITASGGTLQWSSGNTQDLSSRLAMTAVTSTFDTNGNNVTFASAIGSSVAAALTKTGTGTLTLQGTNTYTGATTVNLGTLSLDYGTNDTTKLSNTSALVLGGGTVNLAGATGSHVEVVASTTLTAGTGSYVTRTGLNTAVLQLGTITNNSGTLNIGGTGMATANNTHTAGTILGTWATIGGDWAITAASGTNIPITAYASYTDVARLGTPAAGIRVIADGSTTNVRLTEGSGDSGTVTLGAVTTSINTLNQSISGCTSGVTIDAASRTLRTNGILMGPTAGALTIGSSAGSGTLSSTTASSSVMVTNNSGNLLTINSVIANNTTTSLIKTGTGVLVLNGLSTYTGGTTLQDGTIRVGATVGAFNSNGILGGVFNNGLIIANKSTAVFDLNGNTAFIKDLIGGGNLGGNVTLGSGTLFITNPSNGLTPYNGIISGAGNLSVTGSSGWSATGASTYTGVTRLNGAGTTVTILADGGIASGIGASSSTADRLVFNGGTLAYSNTSATSTNRQFTLESGGGLRVGSTGAITWTSTAAITHGTVAAKTLTFAGTGTTAGLGTLAAAITDSGTGANITSIRLGFGGTSDNHGGSWSLTSPSSTFTGGILLDSTTNAVGTLSYASAGGANPITFNQTTGSATLSYIGSGQTMSGPITASALTTGTITLNASGTGAINYSNTGSLGSATSNTARNLILSGSNTGNNTLAGQWVNNTGTTNAATLTKNGAGTWILINTNGYTGATAVNLGTLRAGAAAGGQAFGNGSAVTLANALATSLDLNGFNQTIGSLAGGGTTGGNVTLGANATLTAGGNNTSTSYAGVISGTGTSGLTKTGSGTLTLTNANTYAGNTLISTGTIDVRNSSALGSGSVSVAAGAKLLVNANSITLANNITLNGTTTNGAIYSGNLGTGNVTNLTGQIALNSTSNVSNWWNVRTLQFSGKITGAGGLNFDLQSGAVGGRYYITAATNDYAGATSVTGSATAQFGYTGQAMLYLGATNALPTTTALTLNYADLYLNGQSQTLPSISGSGTFSVQNGSTTAATLALGSGDTTSGFSGSIKDNGISVTETNATPTTVTGTVALTKIGIGTLTLTNTNTYTGVTTLTGGILRVGTIGNGGVAGNLGQATNAAGNIVFDGGTLDYTGSNATSDRAFTIVAGKTATINSANDISFAGATGAATTGALTKTGNGALTLTGINTNTGATAVNGGILRMGDAAADTFATTAVTVVSGATLGGSGTIAGTLAVSGNLAPGGAGVDIKTLAAGTTTWNGGSIWNFDLSSSGTSSDLLNITGDFNKTGSGFQFNFMGSTPAWNTTYTLVDWSGLTTFLDINDFTFTGLGAGPYGTSSFAFNGSSLTFTAVPEPTSALVSLLITAGLLRRRRA